MGDGFVDEIVRREFDQLKEEKRDRFITDAIHEAIKDAKVRPITILVFEDEVDALVANTEFVSASEYALPEKPIPGDCVGLYLGCFIKPIKRIEE